MSPAAKAKRRKGRLTSIAPWFGGKRTMAPEIVRELGRHVAYFEPFCGSLAVLLAKPPVLHETVNDLHGDLVNLAMVLASDRAPEFYNRMRRTLDCEALFLRARSAIAAPPPELPLDAAGVESRHVDRACLYFIVAWCGRNGVAGTKRINYNLAVRWTPGGGGGGQRWTNAVESVPTWHDRLRNVLILCRDAFELLAKIEDDPRTAIYCDPPYFMSTRGAGGASAQPGGASYLHDFAPADHARLAAALDRFRKARVVVSYYDDPRLGDLYAGWTKRLVYGQKNLHVQNRRGASRCTAPEVLLLNGPSYAEAASLFPRSPHGDGGAREGTA